MKRIRMIALDLDGTLLNSEHMITTRTERALREVADRGVLVVISTGRGYSRAEEYLDQLQFEHPLVLCNGGEIWSQPGQLLNRYTMDTQHILQMQNIAERLDLWYWAFAVEGDFNRDKFTSEPDRLTWIKFGFAATDARDLEAVRQEIEEIGEFEITNSHPKNMELNPKGVNKAAGLRQVCTLKGLQMQEVAAFGDSMNDVAMLRECGIGVAMANAQPSAIAVSNRHAPHHNEDGVAQVLEDWLSADGDILLGDG